MSKEEIIRSLQAAESYWEKGSYATSSEGPSAEAKQQQRHSRSTQRRSNGASSSSKESSPLNSSGAFPPQSSSAGIPEATPTSVLPGNVVGAANETPVHPSSISPFVVESMSEDTVREPVIRAGIIIWQRNACVYLLTGCNRSGCLNIKNEK